VIEICKDTQSSCLFKKIKIGRNADVCIGPILYYYRKSNDVLVEDVA
jgi:hypothetical protein